MKAFMEHEGASKCREFFNNTLLEAQRVHPPLKVRQADGARDPFGLSMSF